MKTTTTFAFRQFPVWHTVVLVSLLILAVLGRVPDSQAGWLVCPPERLVCPARYGPRLSPSPAEDALWDYVARTGYQPLVRSLLLLGLWLLGGRCGPPVLLWWPWWLWLWQVAAEAWPGLRQRPGWRAGQWLLWQGQRLLVLGHGCWALSAVWRANNPVATGDRAGSVLPLGLGCLCGAAERPVVEVTHLPEGGYQARLHGEFTLRVAEDDSFRVRVLILFLSLLDSPGQTRRSRRTRDGRTPVVRQRQLAAWFGQPQPDISRIEGYWQRGAWPELHSHMTPELLTPEVVQRIVQVCVTCPHWTVEQVHQYLHGQELAVTQRQVRQAMAQSGWLALRQELRRRYEWTATVFQPRDAWLVRQLLGHLQRLLVDLDAGQPLPTEERLALTDLQAGCQAAGLTVPPLKAWPWLERIQQVVWGDWSSVVDETIRCPACGSSHVVRKSRQPRFKKFYDEQGQVQEVAVYRYYCRNAACAQGSFTHLPPGLVPYSRHRLEVHLLAVQAYAWSFSTYRRVGQALQVSQMTVYRWVSAWGDQLLPVAAVFGLVRSSGVVGVDEKYVLVPKNDKPAAPLRRWMYVYLAVDVHTYDLLHIALYAHNERESAQAFLLALRAKGYQPQVVVTDLRRDYGPVIAQVFPHAQHHECLFHAEQDIGDHLRKTWGRDYAAQQPLAAQLRDEVVHLFQARTQQAVVQRYRALRDRRAEYVAHLPELQWVFDYLERHWPCLVNSIGSELIPATNNAVEMVIRRFDQHYQNFCGFESIETAQLYLGVFEKIYRFTPFSQDAQPRIRGQSPLQLAGYDLSRRPMPWLCRGYSLDWPVTPTPEKVPNP